MTTPPLDTLKAEKATHNDLEASRKQVNDALSAPDITERYGALCEVAQTTLALIEELKQAREQLAHAVGALEGDAVRTQNVIEQNQ